MPTLPSPPLPQAERQASQDLRIHAKNRLDSLRRQVNAYLDCSKIAAAAIRQPALTEHPSISSAYPSTHLFNGTSTAAFGFGESKTGPDGKAVAVDFKTKVCL